MSQEVYGFGSDAQLFRESARKLLKERANLAQLRAHTAQDPDPSRKPSGWYDEEAWQQVGELGWVAAAIPESLGGLELARSALVAVSELVGQHAFPSPVQSTWMVALLLRRAAATGRLDAAATWLARLLEGQAATLAVQNAQGEWSGASDVRAKLEKAQANAITLDGRACFVQDAARAAFFVVRAQSDEGPVLALVERAASGVSVARDGIVDLTRDQGTLVLEGVQVAADAVFQEGERALSATLPDVAWILAADMVGACEWLLQTTVEYAKVRTQFDRPIGSFQAVKHPLVNAMMEIDRAKSLCYAAAEALDGQTDDAHLLAHMAKAQAAHAAAFVSSRAVQLHGGIGFTWESDVHFFFKRNKHSELLFGDAAYHREEVARLLVGA